MRTQPKNVLLIASAGEAGDEEALRCLLEARPEDSAEAARYRLSRVQTIAEAVAHMKAEPVDVMLLDLAGHDAAEVIARMEQDLLALGVPILLLADEKDEATAHYAISRGAQDYLVKDALNRPWLHSALRMAVDRHQVRAQLRMFADAASHDLRQPLRSTSMYLELLARRYGEDLNEEAMQWLASVENSIQHMWHLIDALLQYTRLDVENMTLKPVDAHAVFEQALTYLKAAIEETGAEVTADALPTVRADASQLEQVFLNLIGNALKFRRDVPPRVHISAERDYQNWIFSCADNGIGIEEAYQDRIFNMFERLHPRDVYPGTGMGLAVCKKIITRHNGRIWVESEPGKGATFFFSVLAV
jgi:light-regulated signal transduction histidine kinase (bacteriophytochrome)